MTDNLVYRSPVEMFQPVYSDYDEHHVGPVFPTAQKAQEWIKATVAAHKAAGEHYYTNNWEVSPVEVHL